jgi:hypothetical protein
MPVQQIELEEVQMADAGDEILEAIMNYGSWGLTSSTSQEGCGSNCL